MTITYTEKGNGLHHAIREAGHSLVQQDGEWKSSNDTAVQAIIDGYDTLSDTKLAKILTIKTDGMARINAAFPAVASLDEIAFYAEFWLSIAPAARVPTMPFKRVIDIYSAAKTAITAVNAASTQSAINAVTTNWPL